MVGIRFNNESQFTQHYKTLKGFNMKSPFEIRLACIQEAIGLLVHNSDGSKIPPEQIIEVAKKFDTFISTKTEVQSQ